MMFDDYGWLCDRERRQRKRFESWKRKVWDRKKKVLIIEIGAGTTVASIRRIFEQLSNKGFYNSNFIRINPRDIEVPVGATCIKSSGLEGIAQLFK